MKRTKGPSDCFVLQLLAAVKLTFLKLSGFIIHPKIDNSLQKKLVLKEGNLTNDALQKNPRE